MTLRIADDRLPYTFDDRRAIAEDARMHEVLDEIYESLYPDRTVIRLEPVGEDDQRRGRDIRVLLRGARESRYEHRIEETIEEKIRSPEQSKWQDLCAEYLSNAEQATLGGLLSSGATWLSYVQQPPSIVIVRVMPMQAFREWFQLNWMRYEDLKGRPTRTSLSNGRYYTTKCKSIPFNDPEFVKFWEAHGCRKITRPVDW